MNDILNNNQKLALALELYNAGDISNAIKIVESYRPKGEWQASTEGTDYRVCSICNYTRHAGTKYNFCPNCGADMRGEE